MLFRSHIVFSIAIWFLVSWFIEMPFYVLIFVLLGTAFVDIDAWNSRVGNRWYLRPLQWVTRHRGVLHSLALALLLSLIVGGFDLWAGFGFFVGYVSHLFLDCFTLSGVKLFWPFSFRIRGFVRSGSWVEDVFFVLFLLVDLGLVFYYLFLMI